MSELEQLIKKSKELSKELYIIGITGTDGKTTTASLISHILNENGLINSTITSTTARIGEEEFVPELLFGKSMEINQANGNRKFFQDSIDKGIKFAVIETTSYSLKLGYLNHAEINSAIFTNLSPEHLDQHNGSYEDYFQTKMKLFRAVRPGTKHGFDNFVLINQDDPVAQRVLKSLNPELKEILFYGLSYNKFSEYPSYLVEGYDLGIADSKLGYGINEITYPLVGKFNVYNMIAAIAACQKLGLSAEQIQRAVQSFKRPEGRFNIVDAGAKDKLPTVIIDHAHTPNGLQNALELVRLLRDKKNKNGRVIVVFGCHGERDRSRRPLMGKIAQDMADVVIITTKNSMEESSEQIINDILEGITKQDICMAIEPERKKAIHIAVNIAKPEDFVIIAGRGHYITDIEGDKIDTFYDKDIAYRSLMGYKQRLGILGEG